MRKPDASRVTDRERRRLRAARPCPAMPSRHVRYLPDWTRSAARLEWCRVVGSVADREAPAMFDSASRSRRLARAVPGLGSVSVNEKGGAFPPGHAPPVIPSRCSAHQDAPASSEQNPTPSRSNSAARGFSRPEESSAAWWANVAEPGKAPRLQAAATGAQPDDARLRERSARCARAERRRCAARARASRRAARASPRGWPRPPASVVWRRG